MKTKTWFLPACAIISLLSVLAIEIVFFRWRLNSDSAFAPIFASWQVQTGQMFPDGMCYSTGIMGISTNLFMIPGLLLSGGNLTAARVSGIFMLLILLFFLLYRLFQTEKTRDLLSPSIAALLFTIPFLGSAATEQYLIEGAYLNQVLWILGGILAFRAFDRALQKKSLAKILLFGALIILIIVAADLHAYRNLLTAFLPLTAVYLFRSLWRRREDPKLKDAVLEWMPFAGAALVGAVLAFAAYLTLSRLYWPTTNQTALELGAGVSFTNRLHVLLNALVSIVGNANAAPLLSLRGAGKLAGYLAAALLYIVLPVYALRNYRSFRRDSTRFLIAFTFIGSLMTILVVLAADLTGVGNDLSRYCLPIYANCLLLAAAVLGDLLGGRVLSWLRYAPVLFALFALVSHGIYWKVSLDESKLLPEPYTMTNFIQSHDLHHGYASYWYAHRFTALTNFDLTIANIRVEEGFIRPDYWLTNKAYYESDFGEDRCFLMLTEGELAAFAPEGLENTSLGEPSETLRYNQFYILVYDENIGSPDRLNWSDGIGYRAG